MSLEETTYVLLGDEAIGRSLVLVVGGRDLAETVALRLGDGLELLDVGVGALEGALDNAEFGPGNRNAKLGT